MRERSARRTGLFSETLVIDCRIIVKTGLHPHIGKSKLTAKSHIQWKLALDGQIAALKQNGTDCIHQLCGRKIIKDLPQSSILYSRFNCCAIFIMPVSLPETASYAHHDIDCTPEPDSSHQAQLM